MVRVLAELETEIRGLASEEKVRLLESLIEDLDGSPERGVEEAWLSEAQRRSREIDSGEVRAIPASEVFAHVRAQLKA